MSDQEDKFKGITVGGIPLKDLIKTDDLEEVEIPKEDTYSFYKKPHVPKKKYDNKRKPIYTKKWTDEEIRKEYGIMTKPYRSTTKNILWVLHNNQPEWVSSKGIQQTLGKSAAQITPRISEIWNHLGDSSGQGLVLREHISGRSFKYRLNPEVKISFEELTNAFDMAKKRKKGKVSVPSDNDKQEVESEGISILDHPNKDSYKGKDYESGDINININVTFRFLFGKS